MTDSAKTILEKYQIRKTKEQKSRFIDYITTFAEEHGYTHKVEKGAFGVRNVVIGDADNAKVIYTAHYDTCARLPFPNFITPKNIGIYILFNVAIVLILLIAMATAVLLTNIILSIANTDEVAVFVTNKIIVALCYIAFLFLFLGGPANKNTANDNTSGVTTLLDIMLSLPEEDRKNVAFIFFDLEEAGMLGSSAYYSKHKKHLKDKLIINFDCVSDGKNILFAVKKKAKKFIPLLEEAFKSNGVFEVEILSKGVFYPSDQMMFPYGVGVASLKKTKRGILYMDRIHTKNDTVYQEENIEFLVNGALKLADII